MRRTCSFLAVLVVASGCAGALGSRRNLASETPTKVQGYAVEQARVDALAISRAPRVLYGGEWVRLVDGRWYVPAAGGWVVFREEPEELRREREAISTEQPPTTAAMPRGPEAAQLPAVFAAPAPH